MVQKNSTTTSPLCVHFQALKCHDSYNYNKKNLLPQTDSASAISLLPYFRWATLTMSLLDTLAALLNQDGLWWQVLPNVVAGVTRT